jgi:hypothetical protein
MKYKIEAMKHDPATGDIICRNGQAVAETIANNMTAEQVMEVCLTCERLPAKGEQIIVSYSIAEMLITGAQTLIITGV